MLLPEDAAFALAALTRLGPGEDAKASLTRLCGVAQQLQAGALAVSITLEVADEDFTYAASDPFAENLDEHQYQERTGPCLEALTTDTLVISEDLTVEGRWIGWTELAVASGVRGMRSVPIRVAGTPRAALNTYGSSTAIFTEPDGIRLGELLAEYATTMLTNFTQLRAADALAVQLREAMESRAVIEQAKGILMGQLASDAETAWTYLVKLSQQSHRKLRDVATTITERVATTGP